MGYHEAKQERNRALLRAVGHIEDDQPQGVEDKDDPEQDHNQLVAGLLQPSRLETSPAPQEPQSEGKVDFDGGVRESVPPASNPLEDHNAFITALLGQHRGENAVDFWPMEGPSRSQPVPEGNPGQEEGDWRKGGT